MRGRRAPYTGAVRGGDTIAEGEQSGLRERQSIPGHALVARMSLVQIGHVGRCTRQGRIPHSASCGVAARERWRRGLGFECETFAPDNAAKALPNRVRQARWVHSTSADRLLGQS